MPAPTNIDPASAIAIGTLPQTITQDVNFGGTTYDVYYKYTAAATDDTIGIFAFGDWVDYEAQTTVYASLADADLDIQLGEFFHTDNLPLQVPVTPGQTYYFKIASEFGSPVTPAILTLTCVASPKSPAPAGSLLVTDDFSGFDAALLAAGTGTLLQFRSTVNGEFGDVVPSGVFALTNEQIAPPFSVTVYDAAFAVIGSPVVLGGTPTTLRGNGLDRFYTNAGVVVKTVSTAAVLGGTTWTLPFVPTTLAPSRDNTILYWGRATVNDPIRRWDLVNDLALADFATAPTGFRPALDTLVLANGDVLVTWLKPSPRAATISHYLANGTKIRDYVLTFPGTTMADGPRLAISLEDDSASFWVWLSGNTAGAPSGTNFTGRWTQFRLSDGATLQTYDQLEFEHGKGPTLTSAWPSFGNSKSCPFLVLREAVAGCVPPVLTSVSDLICGTSDTQTATLTGSGFPVTPLVTVTDPDSADVPITVVSSTSTTIDISGVFLPCGIYTFTVTDADSCASNDLAVTITCVPPVLTSVSALLCGILTEQTATLTGSGFPVTPIVTVTDPSSQNVPVTIVSSSSTEIVISGIFEPCGTYLVSLTDAEACASNDLSFTILRCPSQPTVTETGAPAAPTGLVLTAPVVATLFAEDDTPTAVTYAASTSGGTGTVTVAYDPPSGSLFPIGETLVTVTATDTSDPVQTQTARFTVKRTRRLKITCPTVATKASTDGNPVIVTYSPATVTGGTGAITVVYSKASGSLFSVGVTTVTVTATDSDRTPQVQTCSFSVTVTAPPAPAAPLLLTCPTVAPVTSTNGSPVAVSFSATTTGGVGPIGIVYSPVSGSSFAVGATTVTVTATDSSGTPQVQTCTFTVRVLPPPLVLTCPVLATVTSVNGTPIAVTLPAASTTGGTGSVTLVYNPASGSVFPIGSTIVSVVATDSGSPAQVQICAFTVTVTAPPPTPPSPTPPPPATLTVTCPGNQTARSSSGSPIVVTYPPATAAGGTAPIQITYSRASGSVFPIGVTVVSVTATSADGQTALCSFTVQVTATVSTGQRLLSLSDLTWLGTFKSPVQLATQGGVVQRPYFTLRRVGGVLKTLWLTADKGTPNLSLIQVDYPGYSPTLATAPESTANVRNFGSGHLAHCLNQDGSAKQTYLYGGITWDPYNNCLWIVYGDAYNAGSQLRDPVLIRGDINDAAPDATAVTWSGPWRFSGSVPNGTAAPDSSQTMSHIALVPPAYGVAHVGGATIALGGDFNGRGSPYSNSLWAPTTTPTAATPPSVNGGADLPAVSLVGGDFTHRGRRPGDYITVGCGGADGRQDVDPTTFTRSALTGYFTVLERSGASVWLDWATVKGVLFLASHGRGHIWYNTASTQQCNHGVISRYDVQGPESVVSLGNGSFGLGSPPEPVIDTGKAYGVGPDVEAALYAYDPDQFRPVSGLAPWDVPVFDWGYLLDRFPNFAVSKDVGAFVDVRPNGLAADETSRLIMIPCGYVTGGTLNTVGFYVNVFSVAL